VLFGEILTRVALRDPGECHGEQCNPVMIPLYLKKGCKSLGPMDPRVYFFDFFGSFDEQLRDPCPSRVPVL
jgi:hypothetical protein